MKCEMKNAKRSPLLHLRVDKFRTIRRLRVTRSFTSISVWSGENVSHLLRQRQQNELDFKLTFHTYCQRKI